MFIEINSQFITLRLTRNMSSPDGTPF